jgi:hypothetical protein
MTVKPERNRRRTGPDAANAKLGGYNHTFPLGCTSSSVVDKHARNQADKPGSL